MYKSVGCAAVFGMHVAVLGLCPCVTTPRGFTPLPTGGGVITTNKERGSLWGTLGPRPSQLLPSGLFYWIFFLEIGPCGLVSPPPLECNSILPLVTAVLITPKGAEPPDRRRIGVLGALVLILPSETV